MRTVRGVIATMLALGFTIPVGYGWALLVIDNPVVGMFVGMFLLPVLYVLWDHVLDSWKKERA